MMRIGALKIIRSSIILLIFGITFVFISIMFKPLYGTVLLMFIMLTLRDYGIKMKKIKFTLLYFVLLPLFSYLPYSIDAKLAEHYNLTATYPQQQVMIFDLVANYCWGRSSEIRLSAEKSLNELVKDEFPIASTCSALKPFRWDDLIDTPRDWQYKSPIVRLKDNSLEYQKLQ